MPDDGRGNMNTADIPDEPLELEDEKVCGSCGYLIPDGEKNCRKCMEKK